MNRRSVQCCIVGGGPAGMMLGLLLARAGVRVAVIEKHADFLRDFRGDTVHPSTLDIIDDLGLLDAFLALPHQRLETISAEVQGYKAEIADFRRLRTRCRFIALMPQWDLLDFLAREGRRHPGFDLLMRTEGIALLRDGERVRGVRAATPDGELTIEADLVVAADGRRSRMREEAHLPAETLGAPMDIVWFRLSRDPADRETTGGTFRDGRILVTINRGDYWQCAYLIAKGGFEALREAGLPAFRERVAALLPFDTSRMAEIADWNDVSLLSVAVDRLTRWHRPGLLCIGDAAHAMSPIGGVGINLAVQDAVASANILAAKLRAGLLSEDDLAQVQARRMPATRIVQRLQVLVQRRIISNVLRSPASHSEGPPLAFRLAMRLPFRRWAAARIVGQGFRPERVRSPALPPV